MKKFLILLAGLSLLIPAVTLAEGNVNPWLYLEIYTTDDENIVPPGTCQHTLPLVGPIQCYQPKTRYTYAFIPMHIAKTENGFLGVPFGVSTTGGPVAFTGVVACEGFLQGAGTPPQSTYFGSIGGVCQDWWQHTGYLKYFCSSSDLSATYFNIVPNADVQHYKVINCDVEYDENTSVGGGAQWGGTQTLTCGEGETATTPTTWGKIKDLYR